MHKCKSCGCAAYKRLWFVEKISGKFYEATFPGDKDYWVCDMDYDRIVKAYQTQGPGCNQSYILIQPPEKKIKEIKTEQVKLNV